MTLMTKYSTAPMNANTECSNPNCNNVCCDADGKRIMKPHKARSCAVCGVWYCGDCKKQNMVTSKHTYGLYPDDFGTSRETLKVYKCTACKGTPRKYMQS